MFQKAAAILIVFQLIAFFGPGPVWSREPPRASSGAKSSLDVLMEAMASAASYSEVAVSPDGRKVAWVEHGEGRPGHGRAEGVFVASLKSPSQHKRIAAGSDIAWSPDGNELLFQSGRSLFVVPADGGNARRVIEFNGLLSHPKWSPDGKKIAFLLIENPKYGAGPLGPKPAETGLIEEKLDEQRLGIVDVASGQERLLSPADLYVYEFDWSPDSSQFVIDAAHGSGDNNWYIAQFYRVSAATGELTRILDPKMQVAVPRWSPDGRTIAFIGGLMSDEGFIGGDIYTVPAAGGTPRNLTPDMKASATWFTWVGPSANRIIFAENIDGGSGIAELDTEKGAVTSLWTAPELIEANHDVNRQTISVSRNGESVAAIRQSFRTPPEVWAGPIGKWTRITDGNRSLQPICGEAKSLHWKSDAWTIQGWLVAPVNLDRNKRYPMIVIPHGGPTYATDPHWAASSEVAIFSREGYFVFLPNPRGSTGQGEKFARANVKDFGHGDLRDILSGVDEVLKTQSVDPQRLGITGGSYGGYMTMWAVTQTNRFKAAVAMAGISDWLSYYGENGIDQWMIPFFGASVYDDPAVYARSSPITFIKNVKTPTLICVGEHDIEAPAPQAYEFYRALKRLGVPTQLVVYAGAGHGFGAPKNWRDYIERSLAWFRKYVGSPAPKDFREKQPARTLYDRARL